MKTQTDIDIEMAGKELTVYETQSPPAPAPSSVHWGEPLRITSDDCDKSPMDLVIQQGGNGDWYIAILPEGYVIGPAVRLSTSGGASSRVPGFTVAIAAAYRALFEAQYS
jgi:hypothetical protein